MRLSTTLSLSAFALAGFAFARSAAADVCVELDAQRDNLSEADRSATRTMLERTLEKNGQRVAQSGCSATYRVYHVKLGSGVTVVINGPNDSREMHVNSVDEIPNAYSQMVKSLLTGSPMGAEGNAIDRTNVTTTQSMPPARVTADSLFYLRLGYGGFATSGGSLGPDFGLGWRRELDRLAIDLSIFNVTLGRKDGSYKDYRMSIVKLMGLYYFDPYANNSLYAGAGLGWGALSISRNSGYFAGTVFDNYTGTGLDFELSIGYEMLRVSNIRVLVQLNGSLPTYKATATIDSFSSVTGLQPTKESFYVPTIGLSVGLGFGKANTLVVRTVQ
jgi:hypothetical protein